MVLKGVPTNIYALITDADGEPVEKETKVKVTVTADSTGKAIVKEAEVKTDANGIAAYELEALAKLDRLTVLWETATASFETVEEVIGARLCSLAAVEEDLSEPLDIERRRVARDMAEQFLEDECGVAFRPRYARETLDGKGRKKLLLPNVKVSALRSVEVEEVALSEAELEELELYSQGYIYRESGWVRGAKNITVVYEHGFINPPPQTARVAALLARHIAVKRLSNLEDRATTYSTDEATYSLIQPGVRGMVTALPEVNSFIGSWQFNVGGIV